MSLIRKRGSMATARKYFLLLASSAIFLSIPADGFLSFQSSHRISPLRSVYVSNPTQFSVRNNFALYDTPSAENDPAPAAVAKKEDKEEKEGGNSIDDIVKELEALELECCEKLLLVESEKEAQNVKVEYLGKKGPVQKVMARMRDLPNEDKPKLGKFVNEVKQVLEEAVEAAKERLKDKELDKYIEDTTFDVTLPGLWYKPVGHRHPLQMTMEKTVDIFRELGFDEIDGVEYSPYIESDYYCFEALNTPPDHPARDMQDTFYMDEEQSMMLRTHTSAVQIRYMERHQPPFRIVAPGRVFRKDDVDATHSPIFHQVEILAIEELGNLTLGHLKGTVEYFLRKMFGNDIQVKFRGSFFPFTEPSMEVDVFFKGKWLEVLGCGMVDPRVLRAVGIDPEKYGGFAAGFGIERFAMVIHEIPDIRLFYENDVRFLEQFPQFSPEIDDFDEDDI